KLEPLIAEALKIDWRGGRVRMPGQATPEGPSPELLGNSEAMNRVYDLIARCSDRDLPVLIRGETGTGQELVAPAVCAYGPRRDRPFVAVACKAFDEDRLDDELFGHEPSTLLGADKLRKGSFEHADGGTLFLDEVSGLPLPTQGKLLGVLDTQQVFR